MPSVIAARPCTIPYLSALLPSELELQTLEETDSSEQDDQTDSENAAGNIITVSGTYLASDKVLIIASCERTTVSLGFREKCS